MASLTVSDYSNGPSAVAAPSAPVARKPWSERLGNIARSIDENLVQGVKQDFSDLVNGDVS